MENSVCCKLATLNAEIMFTLLFADFEILHIVYATVFIHRHNNQGKMTRELDI